jgi:hypothetical protein
MEEKNSIKFQIQRFRPNNDKKTLKFNYQLSSYTMPKMELRENRLGK